MKRKFAPALMRELFIIAIGIAAFLHSIWSFGTGLSGAQPNPLNGGLDILHYGGWLVTAMLLAFACDVGMVVASMQIRRNGRNFGMLMTFASLALFTYILQWYYGVHHIAAIPIADGVPASMRQLVQNISDVVAVWVLPGVLPIAATLYTFSHTPDPTATEKRAEKRMQAQSTVVAPVQKVSIEKPATPLLDAKVQSQDANASDAIFFMARCEHCGWTKEGYATPRAAQNAVTAHQRRCEVLHSVDAKRTGEE